jgi:hypothetical protein
MLGTGRVGQVGLRRSGTRVEQAAVHVQQATSREARLRGAGCSVNRPSGWGMSWTMRRSYACRFICINREITSPAPAAAPTGRNRVATNVAISAICETRPVRRNARTEPALNEPTATRISNSSEGRAVGLNRWGR